VRKGIVWHWFCSSWTKLQATLVPVMLTSPCNVASWQNPPFCFTMNYTTLFRNIICYMILVRDSVLNISYSRGLLIEVRKPPPDIAKYILQFYPEIGLRPIRKCL